MSLLLALLDACVLYPACLRDLLLQIAQTDLYRPRWTDAIHDEWIENLLENEPQRKRRQLERTRRLMNDSVRDCLIRGFEELIEEIQLPDPSDRHVVAAAVHGGVNVIVTYNIKDFPRSVLRAFGLEAVTPDLFVSGLMDLDQEAIVESIRIQRTRLHKPPMTAVELLTRLEGQRLVETVARLRPFIGRI